MSIESAHAMLETAKNDAALSEQLQTAEGPEAILLIASEKGYEFTKDELLSVMQEQQLSFGEELSEEELESVAGGWKVDAKVNPDTNVNSNNDNSKTVGDVSPGGDMSGGTYF